MKAEDESDAGAMDIDQVLRRLKDELEDIIALNTDLQVENQKKDQLLEAKEVQLKKLRDIFQSDAEQLEQVSVAARNTCNIIYGVYITDDSVTSVKFLTFRSYLCCNRTTSIIRKIWCSR